MFWHINYVCLLAIITRLGITRLLSAHVLALYVSLNYTHTHALAIIARLALKCIIARRISREIVGAWREYRVGKLLSLGRAVFVLPQSETRSTLVRRIWGRRH